MTQHEDDSNACEMVRIELPCRLSEEAVTISLVFCPDPTDKRWVQLKVVVPGWLGERDSHVFALVIHKLDLSHFLDELQQLYETRDVTISPTLLHLTTGESYASFRAHDTEAEEIVFMGLFRREQYIQDDCVHVRLSGVSWHEEERTVFDPWAWVAGFHGYVMRRDQLPEIIAKLRGLAEDE